MRSICGWPWGSRLGLVYNRALVGTSTSRRGGARRTLKDYITYTRKATLIRKNIGTSLERVITSLGRLKLGRPRHKAFLRKYRKVHNLHLLLLTRGVLTRYKYHPFSFAYHSNIADQIYFLAYATTNLEGRSNQGLAEMIAWRPIEGMRENPWLPNNSRPIEIITTCQYPCITAVQIPFLFEPRMVTAVKCLLQNSKALFRRNGRTKVANSMMAEKSSRMS